MKILKIYQQLILEDFKSQRKKFIEQGYSPDIVDTYLKDFDDIRKAKYREARETEIQGLNVPKGDARFNIDSYKTFRELEILVDFVAGQRKVGSANFEDIKVDGEPIFRNEDVEIYYADTPRACIQYKGNFPYSWCVARNDAGNMFYDYRLRDYEPAFYFVKLIKRTKKEFSIWNNNKFDGTFNDKYHFFVVQVTKYGEYIVTSAQNDGDKQMNWNQILNFASELTELKDVFQPKPLTKEERKKIEKYKKGLSDEEFAKLPYKEKDLYLSIYVQINKPITFEQFRILPEDLKNKYVGFGVGLSDKQFELIKDNKNIIKRYSEITKRKFDIYVKKYDSFYTFTESEQLFIQDKIDKIFYEKGENLKFIDTDGLLKYSTKKDELIDYYIKLKGDEFNDADIYATLLNYSSKKDDLIDYYLNLKGSSINKNIINIMLYFSSKKDGLINYYIKLKKHKLNSDDIRILLMFSSKKDDLIDIYIKLKKHKLNTEDILLLLINSSKRDELINNYIKLKKDKLTANDAIVLSQYSTKKNDELINYFLNLKGDNLTSKDFTILLISSSKSSDELIDYYINLKKGNVDPDIVNIILLRSSNRREVFQKMIDLQNQSKINEQITRIKKMISII